MRVDTPMWLCLCLAWFRGTQGFVVPPLSSAQRQQRQPPPTPTCLYYKVLGAPLPGSDKPTVLEEGQNKIVSGNLNGSFRDRMQDKYGVTQQLALAASTQLEEKKAANGNQYNNNQYDNSQYNTASPQPPPTQLYVQQMRHWGGTLELQMQPSDPLSGTPSAASSVLADFISNPQTASNIIQWNDKVVVELGAGVGTCSIAAAVCGASVVATDGAPTALALLEQNTATYAAHYAYPVRIQPLLWGNAEQAAAACQGQYPSVVLAADLVYPGADVTNLQSTLDLICGPDTWVVWAHEWRSESDTHLLQGLFQAFEGPYEMDISGVPTDKPVSIYMYRKR